MFIAAYGSEFGLGETVEDAVKSLETNGYSFNPFDEYLKFYETKEIKVQRKFEIVKEK